MAKRGRKKITCDLGTRKPYCFWLYPSEVAKMYIEFEKIKRNRIKYQHKEEN